MELSGWVLVAATVIVLGYLVPSLVRSREVRVESRVSDRFSPQLRLVAPALPAPPPRSDARPLVHNPEISRRRTEALAMIRPTTPVANRVNARELAAARAARAAEISRRAAAARRRMTLAVVLAVVIAAVVTAVAVGPLAWGWALLPSAALGAVLYTGRQAAIVAARQDAKARTEMARLDQRLRLFRDREARSEPVAVRPGSFEEIVVGYQGRHVADQMIEDEPPRHATSESLEAIARLDAAGSDSAGPDAEESAKPAVPESASRRTPQADAGADARTWTPVPVPLPTYTLKQESPRRDVEPFTPEDAGDGETRVPDRPNSTAPSYGTVEREPERAEQAFDLDSVLARRRAAGA
ncbi:MAG: hypothetical protein ACQERF_05220 [Actinomycetota bacterium]